jgi:hypothetical protein
MLVQLSDLTSQMQTLFTSDADQAASQSGFIKRRRKLTGPAFAQALVFAWLENPRATVDELVVSLARTGVSLKAQSLEDRFTPEAAEFFRLLLSKALDKVIAVAGQAALPLLRLFQGIFLLDSTILTLPALLAELLPGCGGRNNPEACQAGLKVTVRYELSLGYLEGFNLNPARVAEACTELQSSPLPPGSLRLADLGFFDLELLRSYDKQKVYFISRPAMNLVVYDARGKKCKLARYLARQRGDRIDTRLWVGSGKQLRCRLVAIRAPEEVAQQRRESAQKTAQDHGRQASADRLEICGWTVFLCNTPRWLLTLQQVWVLYRLRWQIELLFKLWKSDGQIDESNSSQPYRVLAEVYAKLLAMVVQHWLLLSCGGGGLSQKSQRKAARAVRKQVGHVAAVLSRTAELLLALEVMTAMVAAAGQVNRRKRRPSTFQTILDPEHDGLSSPYQPAVGEVTLGSKS